jgi:3-dehydroquinate dehydratase
MYMQNAYTCQALIHPLRRRSATTRENQEILMTKEQSTETDSAPESEIGRFMDMLIENQSRINKALSSARKRTTKITEMVTEQVVQGQREALELTKRVATNPSAYSENSKALLDAATEAQSRSLDFAKELYNEQVKAAESLRESMEKAVENSREAAEAAMTLSRSWGANNPLSEAWQKGMESLRS